MTRFTKLRWLRATSALLAAGLVATASMEMAAQGASPYSIFKLSGVVTDCVVPRIAASAPADAAAEVGPAGGADLTDDEAKAAHDCARSEMAVGYAKSGDANAQAYNTWTVYSTAPYTSATHGNRYVNNFANPAGAEYGKFEAGARLPVGSVLVKDSFVVNARGQVVFGVLSLMEKMRAGFNTEFSDWRYTMILPTGEVVGTTGGAGSEKVAFCAGCHVAVDESQGSLYFLPKRFRNYTGPDK
jgi:hypothetical protein